MKKHDWRIVEDDAGPGIGKYDSYECSECGGWGGVPDETFDRRTRPFFTLGSDQIQLDIDCDIAKAQIEELKLRSGAAKKPAIRFLPEAFVEAAKALGADTVKVTFDSKAAVIGAGVPAEVANLLDIVAMEVWERIKDGTRQVQFASPDDFSAHGFARGDETDAKAMAEAIGFNMRWAIHRKQREGRWTAKDLKAAILLLGEEP